MDEFSKMSGNEIIIKKEKIEEEIEIEKVFIKEIVAVSDNSITDNSNSLNDEELFKDIQSVKIENESVKSEQEDCESSLTEHKINKYKPKYILLEKEASIFDEELSEHTESNTIENVLVKSESEDEASLEEKSYKRTHNKNRNLLIVPSEKKRARWSSEELRAAVSVIKDGLMSQRQASDHYGIPRSTIRDHIKSGFIFKKGSPIIDENNCQFVGCFVRKNNGYNFFRFPVADDRRTKKWIRHCGNPKLSELKSRKLNQLFVCERHFKENCFINRSHLRLNKLAIPTHYGVTEEFDEVMVVKREENRRTYGVPKRQFGKNSNPTDIPKQDSGNSDRLCKNSENSIAVQPTNDTARPKALTVTSTKKKLKRSIPETCRCSVKYKALLKRKIRVIKILRAANKKLKEKILKMKSKNGEIRRTRKVSHKRT